MNNNNNNNNNNGENADLKRQLEALQQKVNKICERNKQLEKRVDVLENTKRKLADQVESLESKIIVSEEVSTRLSLELDRLDQYNRRSNLIIKNIDLPANPDEETHEDVEEIVKKVIKDDLEMPDSIFKDIDKFHRNGFIKTQRGKRKQNIIVRFKSHASRYACLIKKKQLKSNKISPNLTRNRGKILHKASEIINEKKPSAIEFAFANIHGDLQIRLAEPCDGKKVHPFNSLNELDTFLLDNNLISNAIFDTSE